MGYPRPVMLRSQRSTIAPTLLLLLAAHCGGPSGSAVKTPAGGDAKKDDSIADLAASQGGLASLGGGRNGEVGTGTEAAMSGPLRAEQVIKGSPVKLDGLLKEWHARSAATESIRGKTDGLAFKVAVQYDDAKIYVGAEVDDKDLVRTKKLAETEDHATFTIAFPAGRGALKAYEIGLFPGKPGEIAGAVRWLSGPSKGKEVAGARIVEAPVKGGISFEAVLPWSSFAEARTMRVGLRGALRWHDGDGTAERGVLGTGKGSVDAPNDLPPLPTDSEQAVVEGLLSPNGLANEKPTVDLYVNLTGDERKERVSVFGKYFTICGPTYRGGTQFFYRELGGELVSLEARDLTGNGREDLVVRRRFKTPSSVREWLEVWSLLQGDEPVTTFGHEIAVLSPDGKRKVTNAARIGVKEIEISVDRADGWNAASYGEPITSDVEPILFPWGTVKSRTFRFADGKFAKASEETQAGAPAPAAAHTGGGSTPTPRDVPTPKVKPGEDLSARVLESYRRDRSVPASEKARFDLQVQLDGDARPERVVLLDRDLVVFGPGYKGGATYTYLTLSQFAKAADVRDVSARDINGDGTAEVVVRGVRRIAPPTGGPEVEVEALFVYQAKDGRLTRAFGIETAREQGGKRVQGLVQFVPAAGGRGFDLLASPGVAKGWNAKSYPWPQEKSGGALEPLLLPWGGVKSVRYTWNGTTFEPK